MRCVVILAGGHSSRMEALDKAEAKVGSKRLIDVVFDRVKPQCDEVLVSATHDYGLGVHCVPDEETLPSGPAGGVLSVAKNLMTRTIPIEGFFSVPVDGPNLPIDFCDRLYDARQSTIAIDPVRTHPSFGWWRLEDLETVMNDIPKTNSLSLHRLARLCNARSVKWAEPNLFFNINTARDLNAYMMTAHKKTTTD